MTASLLRRLTTAGVTARLYADGTISLSGRQPAPALLEEVRANRDELASHLRALGEMEDRLDRGWMMCEAETDPERQRRLDDHWIALLHQYEKTAS